MWDAAMDNRAFERLVAEHQGMVYSVALSHCRDAAEAEDVTQEAFLKAYRSMDGMKKPRQTKTWLYSIARFTAIDHVRKRRRMKTGEVPDRPAPTVSEKPSGRVMEVVRGLRNDYRDIVLMRYVREMSYSEIARELHTTVGSVGEKLFRVREMIRAGLREEAAS